MANMADLRQVQSLLELLIAEDVWLGALDILFFHEISESISKIIKTVSF